MDDRRPVLVERRDDFLSMLAVDADISEPGVASGSREPISVAAGE